VDEFELEPVGIGEEHGVVAGPVLRIRRRRVQDGDARVAQPFMKAVDVLPAVGVPGEMVQTGRITVVLTPALGRTDGEALRVDAGPDCHVDLTRDLEQRLARWLIASKTDAGAKL